jgi:hypothetical protein
MIGWAVPALALLAWASPAACQPVELWETTGLKTPESALPDPAGSFAYVSNIDGNTTEKDGNGFISKVSLDDGKILDLKWAKGLDAPKGMALANGRLYAADIDQLVEIDAGNDEIVARYDAPAPNSSMTSPRTVRAASMSRIRAPVPSGA